MRVLVVEDEHLLASAVARGMRREGIAVDVSNDGDDGFQKITATRYDVIVLDRDLPGMSGDDLCRSVTSNGSLTKILMLTASGTVEDRVSGLAIGADDYLPKPFDFRELLARVRALYRRTSESAPPVLRADDLLLDATRRIVTRAEHKIALTPKEFRILEVLMKANGAVVSSESLRRQVWDENASPNTGVLRVTVKNLRKKLGGPPIIENVVGVGYRISTAPNSATNTA